MHFAVGQVAQSVEQRTENPRVGGSIPPLATNLIPESVTSNPPACLSTRISQLRSKILVNRPKQTTRTAQRAGARAVWRDYSRI